MSVIYFEMDQIWAGLVDVGVDKYVIKQVNQYW